MKRCKPGLRHRLRRMEWRLTNTAELDPASPSEKLKPRGDRRYVHKPQAVQASRMLLLLPGPDRDPNGRKQSARKAQKRRK